MPPKKTSHAQTREAEVPPKGLQTCTSSTNDHHQHRVPAAAAGEFKELYRGPQQPDVPRWAYPSIFVLIALLIGLIGTAYMIATPEELSDAWAYKGEAFTLSYWKNMVAEGVQAARTSLAGGDASDALKLGSGDAALSSPDGLKMAEELQDKKVTRAPPPGVVEKARLEKKRQREEQVAEQGQKTDSTSPLSANVLSCFTLEMYSDSFIASAQQKRRGEHFFRCGTRLIDLRSAGAVSPEMIACTAAAAATSSPGGDTVTAYPHLRVVLWQKEVEWHSKQKLNLAVEVFPLSRLNDGYCDCLDGTDEVSTGACSMSGPGMPLGLERWRSYVTSNRDILLYEDQIDENVGTAASSGKGDTAAQKHHVKGTMEVDVLGGPVLPFVCASDPETWLSPTMVGDGVVDCCDGSDEASEVWLGSFGGGNAAVLSSARQSMLSSWELRRQSAARHNASASFVGKLHPHHTSSRALLVDKGHTSLYTCPAVHAQRLATAQVILDITQRGHITMLERERDGWERLGRAVLGNQTHLAERLGNVTNEAEQLQRSFVYTMEKKQTADPVAAGIPVSELQHYEFLMSQRGHLEQEASYLSLIVSQKVFGDHYEYYPLFINPLSIYPDEVLTSFASDAAPVRAERARRRMSARACMQRVAELEHYDQYTDMARQQGIEVPPPPQALHVDNMSAAFYEVVTARVGLFGQRLANDAEAEEVARARRLIASGTPYNKTDLESRYPAMARTVSHVLGHWQPYSVARDARIMAVLDPAGDVDLPRRFSIAPTSRLTRGGGRLQASTRKTERDRSLIIEEADDTAQQRSKRSQQRQADDKDKKKKTEIPIMYHRNTPNILATHTFLGGSLRCELSQGHESSSAGDRAKEKFTSMSVAYGCATEDAVLAWAKNGKCNHEVIVGTPSACSRWVLREVEQRVERYLTLARE